MRACCFACVLLVSACNGESSGSDAGVHVTCDADAGYGVGPGGLCYPVNACLEGCVDDGGCVVDPATRTRDPETGFCSPSQGSFFCNTDSTHVCIKVQLFDFNTGEQLNNYADPILVAAYDPLVLANDPKTVPLAVDSSNPSRGGFAVMSFIDPPADGFLIVGVRDEVIAPTPKVAQTLRPFAVTAGNVYRVDLFVIEKTVADEWTGFTNGAYLPIFFDARPPAPTELAYSKAATRVSGVKVTAGGGAISYFSSSTALDASLTATGSMGAAITAGQAWSLMATGGTCAGGTCTWPSPTVLPITQGIVFELLYNCALDPKAAGCP